MPVKIEKIRKPDRRCGLQGTALFNETRRAEEILTTMNENTYENLVTSWAYWCLKDNGGRKYEDVMRIGGTGDKGVDVIAYFDQKNKVCDIYQCKHYNHPIRKSDVIGELGKFLFFMAIGELPVPETYYLMAPQGLGDRFLQLYENADLLKQALKDSWEKKIAGNIEKGKCYSLEGKLLAFVETFDYTRFKFYSSNKFLETLVKADNRFVFFQYFGYRKEHLKRINKETPQIPEVYEKKYIGHLLDAYNDANVDSAINELNVTSSKYSRHFGRSRDEFWLAESVKKMGEENCLGDIDEFAELKDDMEDHVADTYEGDYANAYEKVKKVTEKAESLPKKDRVISGELGPRELKGVCYQLSNEDRLIWKEEEKS